MVKLYKSIVYSIKGGFAITNIMIMDVKGSDSRVKGSVVPLP